MSAPIITYRDHWTVARNIKHAELLSLAIDTLHTPTFLELEDLFRVEEIK